MSKAMPLQPLHLTQEELDKLSKLDNIGQYSLGIPGNGNVLNQPIIATAVNTGTWATNGRWSSPIGQWTSPMQGESTADIDIDSGYAIQGRMIRVSWDFSEHEKILSDNIIKEKIALRLARELIAHNLIEFTKHDDPATYTTRIRGRLFAVPDDQVRILRKSKKGIL